MLGPSAKPADFVREIPKQRSRCSIWSTWWPAATASPAGETGASIRPTAGQPIRRPAQIRRMRFTPLVTRSIIASRHCRWWTAFSFPTAEPAGAGRFGRSHVCRVPRDRQCDVPATSGRAASIPTGQGIRQLGLSWMASTMPRPVMACCSCTPTRGSHSIWTRSGGQTPARELLRFRAMTGNTETASEQGMAVFADLWVLVDGQVRFQAPRDQRLQRCVSDSIPDRRERPFPDVGGDRRRERHRLGLDHVRRSAAGIGDGYVISRGGLAAEIAAEEGGMRDKHKHTHLDGNSKGGRAADARLPPGQWSHARHSES